MDPFYGPPPAPAIPEQIIIAIIIMIVGIATVIRTVLLREKGAITYVLQQELQVNIIQLFEFVKGKMQIFFRQPAAGLTPLSIFEPPL